jgi:hypothetical protein
MRQASRAMLIAVLCGTAIFMLPAETLAATARNFKATFHEMTLSSTCNADETLCTFLGEGSGHSNLLGRITESLVGIVDLSEVETGCVTASDDRTFVVDNGTLHVINQVDLCFSSGATHVSGTWEVVGGTGILADATGGGTVTGTLNLGQATVIFRGTLLLEAP